MTAPASIRCGITIEESGALVRENRTRWLATLQSGDTPTDQSPPA